MRLLLVVCYGCDLPNVKLLYDVRGLANCFVVKHISSQIEKS